MAKRGASKTEDELSYLLAAGSPDFWQRPEVRQAARAQGVSLPSGNLPTSDAANPLTGDAPGPASMDVNGITAVSATDAPTTDTEDDLDALNQALLTLQQATAQRRAANTLKQSGQQQVAATQQAVADDVQRALGTARQVSGTASRGIRERVFRLADRIGAIQTPGGLLLLVMVLLILRLTLVEANGQPPLVWLYLVLTRRAHLRSEKDAAALSATGAGAREGSATGAVPAANAEVNGHSPVAPTAGSLIMFESSAVNRYLHG